MRPELRSSRRRILDYPAQIDAGSGQHVACVVKDMSNGGAKLILLSDDAVPEKFRLLLDKAVSVTRECAVVWRSERQIGVKFLR